MIPLLLIASATLLSHSVHGDSRVLSLSNGLVRARWELAGDLFRPIDLADLSSKRKETLDAPDFVIGLDGAVTVKSTQLKVEGSPVITGLKAEKSAPKLSDRLGGRELTIQLTDPDGRFHAT